MTENLPPPTFIKIKKATTEFISNIKKTDIEYIIKNRWDNIQTISKKSFLWIFLITNFIFLFHTVHFLWGDHDWFFIKYPMGIASDNIQSGRFFSGLIQQIFGGHILPVINNVFCFSGFTLAVIYLAKYWKIPQTTFCYTLFGLFIILMPHTCCWLWYVKNTTILCDIFLVIFPLYLSLSPSFLPALITIPLFVVCWGTYPALLSTAIVVLSGRIFIDLVIEHQSFKDVCKTYFRTFIYMATSLLVFIMIVSYLKRVGIVRENEYNAPFMHNIVLPTFDRLPYILTILKNWLFRSRPFISTSYKVTLLLPSIYVLYRILRNKITYAVSGLFILVVIIFSCNMSSILSRVELTEALRIELCSTPYFYAFFIAVGLRGEKIIKSLCLILMFVASWESMIADVNFQKVFYLGKKAEASVMEDVITRIKSHKNFDPYRRYVLLATKPPALRKNFYASNPVGSNDYSLLWASTGPVVPFMFNAFEERPFIEITYNYFESFPDAWATKIPEQFRISPADLERISDFFFNKAEVYPRENSVYVDDNFIFVIFTEEGLRNTQNMLAQMNAAQRNWR